MSFINTRDVIGDQATLDGLVGHTLSEFMESGANSIAGYAFHNNTGLNYVEMPGIVNSGSNFVGGHAFAGCENLKSAVFADLKRLGSSMFQACSSLTTISAPELVNGGISAFQNCINLRSVNLPNLKTLSSNMFHNCVTLTTVIMPEVTSGSAYAFFNCYSLGAAAFPKLATLQTAMFTNCTMLSSVTFSSTLSEIPQSCFANCMMLSDINLQNITTLGSYAFSGCTALMSVSIPSVDTISNYAFQNTIIDHLRFTSIVMRSYIANITAEVDVASSAYIYAYAFDKAYNLSALILRNESLCTLQNTNALSGTPIANGRGYIYVPDALLGAYKEATNWATYASQIVSLEEYPIDTVTGTITDSWSDIFAAEEDGTYTTKYNIGDTKVLTIGKFKIPMQIVAMDTDELANGSGNAKITWLTVNLPFCGIMIDSSNTNNGWGDSNLRSGMLQTLYNHMDTVVKNAIKNVKKTSLYKNDNTIVSEDLVWIPSCHEILGSGQYFESSGCMYTAFFTDATARIKRSGAYGDGDPDIWLTRTLNQGVSSGGNQSALVPGTSFRIAFGFCT